MNKPCKRCGEALTGKRLCCLVQPHYICSCGFKLCVECFNFMCHCPERIIYYRKARASEETCCSPFAGAIWPHYMLIIREWPI